MISELCIVAAAGVLSLALRSFHNQACFRIGTLGFIATSFLAGWLLGGSIILGAVFASTWFLLPWLEILTRARRLRLPLHRQLEKCPPPPSSQFPDFSSLSDEMEALGFEYADDVDWCHDETRHFYRLFYNAEKRVSAAICLLEQDGFSFFYVTFTSRAVDGRVFMTWNYPFSYGMHLLPQTILNRVDEELSVEELALSHMGFLGNQPDLELIALDAKYLRIEIERDLRTQLEHNIARGILVRDKDEMIRYSVRGMFFLWGQFLREFVKFS
ncbi:MAG: hypothetical protein NTZ08_01365 [Verrucomicrobia bacterium]|nr:hypothetical protein [Verrucomicrobiota bacterium]